MTLRVYFLLKRERMHQIYKTYIRLLVMSVGLLGSSSFLQARPTPENCRIVFDVDDVLLVLESGIKPKLVRHIVIRPPLWKEVSKLRKFSCYAEKLIRKHKNTRFAKLLTRIKYGKVPVKGMVEILQELKDKGYTLHILSNMARADFEYYKTKYPEIFNHFDGEFVVENSSDISAIKKPDPVYFHLYRSHYSAEKDIFFIDDKAKNCQASGFRYTHTFKNAKTLRLAFKAYGIL